MTTKRPYQPGNGLSLSNNLLNVEEHLIDHNELLNYNSNQHIDWTNATEDFHTTGSLTVEGDVNFNTDSVGVSTLTYKVKQPNSFSAGQPIRVGDGNYLLADCTTPDNAEVIGVVIRATSTEFTYAQVGYTDFSLTAAGLSSGTLYYLGETAGTLTAEKPTTEGYIVKPILQTMNIGSWILNYRGIEIEQLVKDEDDMSSDSDAHMATQQSIKAYTDAAEASAKSYADSELTDYADDTVTFTNKTIDADDNTISNLEHGSEVDAPSAGTGVTHGHIDDGAQTLHGVKTFNSFPVTPSEAPTSDYEVANKKYVDDEIGDIDYSSYALKSNVLELDNTTAFTPDADYEPATKKYVDDNAGGSGGASYPDIFMMMGA